MHRKSQGFNWGPSGVSTALWTGVLLRDVLLRAGVDESRASSSLHVHFAGPPGELPKGDGTYGTSIPLAYALNPAHDVLLAYKQNGRWLAPDHGFPVGDERKGRVGSFSFVLSPLSRPTPPTIHHSPSCASSCPATSGAARSSGSRGSRCATRLRQIGTTRTTTGCPRPTC